jgi:hypothetical protein
MKLLMNLKKNPLSFFFLVVILSVGVLYAQEQVGGPYTADEHTMLLLHFDGDLTNTSTNSADGEFQGDASNFYFLPNTGLGLGQCLRIDNDSQSDSAYVTVADADALDLTGDWTIEGWINIFTFGEGPDDWRWVPRLIIKTGDEVFWRPNYFVEMWGSTRFFSCGYQTASQDAWPQANSVDNTMQVGQWYHMAFIRDTSRHLLLTIIHDADKNLVSFSAADYTSFGAADVTPIVTDQPVHIGYAGGGGDSFLDGFVDEIRVSNVVREYSIPPIITNATALSNQSADLTSYEVGANVYTVFGSSSIASAEVIYDAGSGWQSVAMATVSGDSMSAAIPQQPSGSIIKYYIKATDSNGLTYFQPQNAETDESYYSFGIYTPNTMTLGLDFEEGSGVPQDASSYAHTVTMVGTPEYSTNAAVGNYSIHLDGDSSYLEVDSPFLASEEFTVDLWLNADSLRDYCRIFNRPLSVGSWYENNYQIRFNNAGNFQAISDGSVTLTADNFTVELGKWYHLVYEVRKASASDTCNYYATFQVSDQNSVLFQQSVGFDQMPIQAMAPLRIGKSTDGDYPPYFAGYFDDIKVYNYAVGGFSATDGEMTVPLKYKLSQNYPNPFNPTTQIRFEIPETQNVTLTIYDILGRNIRTMVNSEMSAGKYTKTWDGLDKSGSQVASGIYFYRLQTNNFVKVRKMVLVR